MTNRRRRSFRSAFRRGTVVRSGEATRYRYATVPAPTGLIAANLAPDAAEPRDGS